MTGPDDEIVLEPLTERMQALASRAPTAPGLDLVMARVAERHDRRRRLQAVGAVVASTAVVVTALAVATRLRDSGGGAGRDAATAAAPATGPDAGGPVTTSASVAAAVGPRAAVPWRQLVAFTAKGWSLARAEAWNGLRPSGWPTPYTRTYTWSTVDSPGGLGAPYVVVQSDIGVPADDADVQTVDLGDGRRAKVAETNGVTTVTWSAALPGRGDWTMRASGWKVDRGLLVAAVAGARWDDVAERWILALPAPWKTLPWPTTGAPREVLTTYTDRQGRQVRIAQADAPGRFGADLVTLAGRPNHAAKVVMVGGYQAYAVQPRTDGPWELIWPFDDRRVVRVLGADGMALDDLVIGLIPLVDTGNVVVTQVG